MASTLSPPPLHVGVGAHDNKMLNASSNTSGSSTASSVLIRSTNPPTHKDSSLNGRSDRKSPSSSFSSTSSQRVSIKAKYLREVKSPFEVDDDDDDEEEKRREEFIPPALPGNLPPDYEQRRETADAVTRSNRSHPVTTFSHGNGVPMNSGERISNGDGVSHKNINNVWAATSGLKGAANINLVRF